MFKGPLCSFKEIKVNQFKDIQIRNFNIYNINEVYKPKNIFLFP